ncbi:MFS transporter [Brackiella oedipodis]|uniref:MFS transporter n=1 Tax=Brackiella oedipodis TaxID=124225 RepID=UPI00048EEC3A|nr:MFS transporter [Brackiella oedipodis]
MQTTSQKAARLLLFALAIGSFAIGTTEFSTMSLVPFIADDFQIAESTAGHLITAYALGVVVGAPLISIVFATWSKRKLLIALMLFFALLHAVSALAPHYNFLLLSRFLAGLPHGAYFGVASLVAVSLVPQHKRAQAVGLVMTGLTVSTILGVLCSGWLAELFGWRINFWFVSALSLFNVYMVWRFFASTNPVNTLKTHPIQELGALRNPRVWLLLGIGIVGFCGMFSVYTYAASALIQAANVPRPWVPPIMCLFGVGMTFSNIFVTRLFGAKPLRGIATLLLFSAVALFLYSVVVEHWLGVAVVALMIGLLGAAGSLVQVELMDNAKDAQTLAAALNHSAFNIANALGPFLGGLALDAGFGWGSPGIVGSIASLLGLALCLYTMHYFKKTAPQPAQL